MNYLILNKDVRSLKLEKYVFDIMAFALVIKSITRKLLSKNNTLKAQSNANILRLNYPSMIDPIYNTK